MPTKMPALRKRSRTAEPAAIATTNDAPQLQPVSANHDLRDKISEYELSREQRIRENRERMGKLGIFDLSLSLKLKSQPPSRRASSTNKTPPSLPISHSGPVRRSARLQNVTPVSYSEVPKKGEDLENGKVLIEAGAKPEVYTEEHEKLLGNTEKSWTLFVDGYGKDGKRIYDCVRGKTCHQCRQKTLGYRTHCSQCNMVQGQFCGDCLYMRYGEHVLEALQNPTWICPVCRGICNCSLCRQAKGWAPTGTLYKRISALGYKSVAHYLIQTRRSDADAGKNVDVEKNADTSNQVSAKRLLPFSELDVNEFREVNEAVVTETHTGEVSSAKRLLLFPVEQDQLKEVECSDSMMKESHEVHATVVTETHNVEENSSKRSLLFSGEQDQVEKVERSDTIKPLQLEKIEFLL